MNYSDAFVAMQSFFKTSWNGRTPIVWNDDPSKPPNGDWVRFNIIHADGGQASMGAPGSNRFDRDGQVIIQIFTKEGDFAIKARGHASLALDIYSGTEDSGIRYTGARVNEIGADQRGWHQVNVIADFSYQSIT